MRHSPARFALGCLGLLLVVFPLTLQKPGLPPHLKADEPAYYLAARSLWEDHDLLCEPRDLLRLNDDFLVAGDNLILMTTDGWRHAYFSKPFLGSLVAAPAVALFGANGFVALNMAYLVLCAWLGYLYLRRRNPDGDALLFSTGYFLVSASFAYVFWLQPEVFHLFGVTLALFLCLHDFSPPADPAAPATGRGRRLRSVLFNDATRWAWAGLAIAPAIFAKPVHAAALLPCAVSALGQRGWRRLLVLGAATGLSLMAIAGLQHQLTGTWSPYLGVERQGFNIKNPLVMPAGIGSAGDGGKAAGVAPEPPRVVSTSPTLGSWSWIFRIPSIELTRLPYDVRNYFLGRHTGILVFQPFLLVALILFAGAGGWRRATGWGGLAGLAAFISFFVLFECWNPHGGNGFVGNRYFIGIYPLGLFLVEWIRPRLLIGLGFLLGALFLGQVLFAPLGPPVDEPTLQAYTRSLPFRWLPMEFTLLSEIPGYRGIPQGEAYLRGRKDQVYRQGAWLKVIGRGTAELFFRLDSGEPSAAFLLRNYAPGNRITLRMGGSRERREFPATPPPPGGWSDVVVLALHRPDAEFRPEEGYPLQRHWYLDVETTRAARPSWWGQDDDDLVAVELLHVGAAEVLDRDVYGAAWSDVHAPGEAAAGSTFAVTARIANTSAAAWTLDSEVQVHLAYRWLDGAGGTVVAEGRRTELPRPLAPGDSEWVLLTVVAPPVPGAYRLVLEPVYEYVRWFGGLDPASRAEVDVCVGSGAPGSPPP